MFSHRPLLFLMSFGAVLGGLPGMEKYMLAIAAAPTGISAIPSPLAPSPDTSGETSREASLAQSLPTNGLPAPSPSITPPDLTPDEQLPEERLPQLPPVEDLLGEPAEPSLPEGSLPSGEDTFFVSGIELDGSTVFSGQDFADLFAQYTGRPVSFNELLQLRSAVTQRYIEAGYITSGAFIPPQTLENGVVTVQVIEGVIDDIEVVGTRRLNPRYIRSRLGLAAQPPINTNNLLEGLQRLQIDPLIAAISADLQAGIKPGTSILRVEITEADSFTLTTSLDNGRSPNIGSARRRLELREGNVFGIGDRAFLGFSNTDGSNSLDASYSIPVSPYNTRINIDAGISESRVIDDNFEVLDISADAYYTELGLTHPLIETPSEELYLGLSLAHKRTQTRLGIDDIGPFPLSPGADSNGETRVSALQFIQGWTKRDANQVFAARSQFNLGLNLLNATRNDGDEPDSQYFSWRGQGQWVRLLGKDSLFLLRGDMQLAADSLLSSEQFGLGGQQTVRGYRQEALLRDSGVLLSAEARFPILRFSEESRVQITPFLDAGAAWNYRNNPAGNNVLVGTGVGLLWQQGEDFSARLDWGLPLVDAEGTGDSLQDNGFYFSVQYNLL